MTGLVLAGLAAVAATLYAVQVYRRRELPIAGRGRLAALRVAILVGVLVLLADLSLPAAGGDGPPRHWVVVDASPSMEVPGPSGTSPAQRAAAQRPDDDDDLRTADFGAPGAEGGPDASGSRLAPVLRRAAEAGAREVTVMSDLRLADVPEVAALRESLELSLRFVDVGEDLRSAGIAALDVPATGRAGEEVEVSVEVFGTAAAEGADARVEVLRDGEPAGETGIRLPAPGRTVSVRLPVALPDTAGPVLWRARVVLEADAVASDDQRSAFTEVDPLEGLLALVSLEPDWEPRFLLPVLERVTGLPTRGWLAVGGDAFLPMDGSGGVLDDAALSRVAQDARFLVVHGLTGQAPPWLVRAQAEGRRVLVFAHDVEGAAAAGVTADGPRTGEWYAAAAGGPLAAAFAGVPWADLPPLASPLAPDAAGTATALELERAGGLRAGVVALQEREGRRRAVVLARGFWRWGFRPGPGTDAYDRLWSGVAGWLLALDDEAPGGGLGPAERVAAAGRPVAWWAPVAPGGTVEVVTAAVDGSESRTDTVQVGDDGRAALPSREPGSYAWTARVLAPDSLAARDRSWAGRLELESHTDEFRWPRDTTLTAWDPGSDAVRTAGPGRPLRTSPWPYLLLLGLLSAEWILRRRSGLR